MGGSFQVDLFKTSRTGGRVDTFKTKPKAKQKKIKTNEPVVMPATRFGMEQIDGLSFYEYCKFDLIALQEIDGIKYSLRFDTQREHADGFLGGASGIDIPLDFRDIKAVKKLFDDIMDDKKIDLLTVYHSFNDEEKEYIYDYHHLYYEFRLIPVSNYFVIISDMLVDMWKELGFDFPEWYKEYNSLSENMADVKHVELAKDILWLISLGDDLKEEIELILKVKTSMVDIGRNEFFSLSNEELDKKIKELGGCLLNVEEMIVELREVLNGQGNGSGEFDSELVEYGIIEKKEMNK